VSIRELLSGVATGWSRVQGLHSPAHRLLANADSFIAPAIPAGYLVAGSGGKGVPTLTPWAAVFDPSETDTAQHGMYIVYLFAEDMTSVALSLNQGVTEVVNQYRAEGKTRAAARQRLQAQAAAVRAALTNEDRTGWETSIGLHSRGALQVDYEHGHLLGRTYPLSALPAENELVADLLRLIAVYEDAIAVRDELRLTSADAIVTTTTTRRTAPDDALLHFRPKNDAEYIAHMTRPLLVKSPRHEGLIAQFAEYVRGRGFEVGNNVYPRDLVLRRDGTDWLIEAKVVYRGNATAAVRAVIGQLFTYRHVLYRERPEPRLAAVFTEHVGDLYTELLDSLSIASIWKLSTGWARSVSAKHDGL
jgi:hypothetical protein